VQERRHVSAQAAHVFDRVASGELVQRPFHRPPRLRIVHRPDMHLEGALLPRSQPSGRRVAIPSGAGTGFRRCRRRRRRCHRHGCWRRCGGCWGAGRCRSVAEHDLRQRRRRSSTTILVLVCHDSSYSLRFPTIPGSARREQPLRPPVALASMRRRARRSWAFGYDLAGPVRRTTVPEG